MNEIYNSLIDKINTEKQNIERRYNTNEPTICPYCNKPTENNEIIHEECIEPYENIISARANINIRCECGNLVNTAEYRCPICYETVSPIIYDIYNVDLEDRLFEERNSIVEDAHNKFTSIVNADLPNVGEVDEIELLEYGRKRTKTDKELDEINKTIREREREIESNTLKRTDAKSNIDNTYKEIANIKENRKTGIVLFCFAASLVYWVYKIFSKYGATGLMHSAFGVLGLMFPYVLILVALRAFSDGVDIVFNYNTSDLKKKKADDLAKYNNDYNNYNNLVNALIEEHTKLTTEKLNLEEKNKAEIQEYDTNIKIRKDIAEYIRSLTININTNSIIAKIQKEASYTFNNIKTVYDSSRTISLLNSVHEFENGNITMEELIANIRNRLNFLPKIELDDFCNTLSKMSAEYINFNDLENAILYYMRLEDILTRKTAPYTNTTYNQFRNNYYNAIDSVLINKNIDLMTLTQKIYTMIPANISFNKLLKNTSIFACLTEHYVLGNCIFTYNKALISNEYTENELSDMRTYLFYIITDLINIVVKMEKEEQHEFNIEQEERRLAEIEEQRQHEIEVANIYRESAEYEAEQSRYEAEQARFERDSIREANNRAMDELMRRNDELNRQNNEINKSLNSATNAISALSSKIDDYEKQSKRSMLDSAYIYNEQKKAELWAKTLNKK